MGHNNGTLPSGAPAADAVTRAQEFAAFDRLPTVVREALHATTFDISAVALAPAVARAPSAETAAQWTADIDAIWAANFRRQLGMWW